MHPEISLIICSRQTEVSSRLHRNVEDMIGASHEWIVIDDSRGHLGIAEAYEKGTSRAKGQVLCFMHDDILFRTPGWGKIVLEHLKCGRTGVLGVVGGHLLPAAPATWFSSPYRSGQYIDGKPPHHGLVEYRDFWDGSGTVVVAAVDGFWMCVRRDVAERLTFDSATFPRFHGYDLDICMQAWAMECPVRVAGDILIEHFSTGDTGLEWLDALDRFHEKWKGKLPLLKGIELPASTVEEWGHRIWGSLPWYRKYIQERLLRKGVETSWSFRLGRSLTWPLRAVGKLFGGGRT